MNKKKSCSAVSVVLPCAGRGTRLGIQGPKELFEVIPGVPLIDFSLAHLYAAAPEIKEKLTVAVVIRPGKESVAEYVRNRLSGIEVRVVHFDSRYREWPGSVMSAEKFFSPVNIVLLPDSLLYFSCSRPLHNDAGESLVSVCCRAMETHPVLFGTRDCTDSRELAQLGAVKVENRRITLLEDKPDRDFFRFNAFWGFYGFWADHAQRLYDFLLGRVENRGPDLSNSLPDLPAAVRIAEYHDLGTFKAIEKYEQRIRRFVSDPDCRYFSTF